MLAHMRALVRGKRRAPVFRLAANLSHKYLRAYYNESFFEFQSNGEAFVIAQFARWFAGSELRAWDVGAHDGEWALAFRASIPSAAVTSFEIVPAIADRLRQRLPEYQGFKIETFGLSDKAGEVEVVWNQDWDTCNAIHPRLSNALFEKASLVRVPCRVQTVDDYWRAGHAPPHFLKIDTEGHEAAVLEGGAGLLSDPAAPALIQFEYGDTWIPGGHTLAQVHERLSGAGYWLGRLYPNHVEFKPYQYEDEHFRMGNMIAVRDLALKALLAG